MKKLGLHVDALAALILVFLLSFGFNFYQRYQYADMLEEHISLQFQVANLELGAAMTEAKLKKCEEQPEISPGPVD